MEEIIARIVTDTIKYYKSKKTIKELEEVPIDILRCMYLDLLHNKENEEEHKVENRIIKIFEENYIPKSVIREKIKKMEELIITSRRQGAKHTLIEASIVKSELKELLGEEK